MTLFDIEIIVSHSDKQKRQLKPEKKRQEKMFASEKSLLERIKQAGFRFVSTGNWTDNNWVLLRLRSLKLFLLECELLLHCLLLQFVKTVQAKFETISATGSVSSPAETYKQNLNSMQV
jgi:hypothetical protein